MKEEKHLKEKKRVEIKKKTGKIEIFFFQMKQNSRKEMNTKWEENMNKKKKKKKKQKERKRRVERK